MLQFLLTIINYIEPYWFFFKEEDFHQFFYEKLKKVVSLLQTIVQLVVLENVIRNLIIQDLSVDANL